MAAPPPPLLARVSHSLGVLRSRLGSRQLRLQLTQALDELRARVTPVTPAAAAAVSGRGGFGGGLRALLLLTQLVLALRGGGGGGFLFLLAGIRDTWRSFIRSFYRLPVGVA